ncbi:MAG: DNA alkylation repair protein [Candidatus Eisenbacteria bacterium]
MPSKGSGTIDRQVSTAIALLKRHATRRTLDGMARYGIPSHNAFGVSMADMRRIAKGLGRSHELAAGLWDTGRYEGRMLATLIDEPGRVTAAQMDRWCQDFDSWAICDTACFMLFDRTPHAWRKIAAWSGKRAEFSKRASFALLASVALHDKFCDDAHFLKGLALVERAAEDERNFVKKGVSWALRSIGQRNPALHQAAVGLAKGLAASPDATARWVGRDALRDLMRAMVVRKVEARQKPKPRPKHS